MADRKIDIREPEKTPEFRAGTLGYFSGIPTVSEPLSGDQARTFGRLLVESEMELEKARLKRDQLRLLTRISAEVLMGSL